MHLATQALALVVVSVLPAQQATVSLPAPTARLSAEFSDLTAMRELRDGRVLLYDRKEERLVVADFSTGSLRSIGRLGRSPGEFESIAALLPLGGDSTLVADFARRWLILDGDKVVATLPPGTPAIRSVSLWPLGADRQGYVLAQAFSRSQGLTDSTLLSTADGWLVVKRLPTADEPETRYDLIDKTGVRRSRLVLRPNEHILGFGAASVYVIETDNDGIQRLRRRPYGVAPVRP